MFVQKLRIIQHNVLQWGGRRHALNNTYHHINADIILLNSHGVKTGETLKIPGYRVHTTNKNNRHMDGTAIAIKHNIQHKLLDNFLLNTLAVEVKTNTGNIIIATDYLPPTIPFIPTPDYTTLFRHNIPVYLFGDLNANHPTLGYRSTNTKGRQIHRLLLDRTLQHIGPHFPTYYAHNTATTPDIILTNYRTYHNIHITQGPLTTSDHIPIIADIATTPIQIPTSPRPNFTAANWTRFTQDIESALTNTPDIQHATLEEIDSTLEHWYNTIHRATTRNIPTTHHKTLSGTTPNHTAQFITAQYTALRDNAQIHGWTYGHYTHYKALQRQLQVTLKQAADTHWSNTITNTANTYRDPATFWRKIRTLTGHHTPDPHYIFNANNEKCYTNIEMEGVHREIWQTILNTDNENDEDNTHENEIKDYLQHNIHRITPHNNADPTRLDNENMITQETTPLEIKTIIKQMKKTCPGQSGINKTILSRIPPVAVATLAGILNSSLSAGYFPDKFKQATIRLIPKQGKSPHIATNYRPISLLEVPGKIFERIINRRLRIHLEDNDLHNPHQYGFRPGRGTTQALALITEQIAINKSHRGQCQVVLRDITKAFDKVWHLGLKYKILQLELPTILEKLLCDFLDDRMAKIKINTFLGASFNLGCGVPQGSILSPTLFIAYTRDIPTPTQGLNIGYADDITQITGYPGKSKKIMNRITERETERINDYEKKWKIKTNVLKFTPIPLGTHLYEDLIINEEAVEPQTSGRILGLKINTRGYTTHVSDRKGRAMAALIKIFRFRHMNTHIKLHLVKALVLPVLDYPPIPTHTLSKTQLKKLQRVQNKALRFATEQRYPYTLTTEQIHTLAKLDPINIRLHKQAKKIWENLEATGNSTHTQLKEQINNITRCHAYFPSSIKAIAQEPQPIFT